MNQPLSSSEQLKVIFFWLGMLPIIGAGGLGIFLILLTLWGLRMSRKSQDFSYIDTIYSIHKVCSYLGAIGIFILASSLLKDGWYKEVVITLVIIAFFIPSFYRFLVNYLFFDSLRNHKEWVMANGIFATEPAKPKELKDSHITSLVSLVSKKAL